MLQRVIALKGSIPITFGGWKDSIVKKSPRLVFMPAKMTGFYTGGNRWLSPISRLPIFMDMVVPLWP